MPIYSLFMMKNRGNSIIFLHIYIANKRENMYYKLVEVCFDTLIFRLNGV